MADSIPDLWGAEIDLNDLSPTVILNTQAAILEKRTKGLIVAELIQQKSKHVTELFFDMKSQAARHRSRLLTCRYVDDNVYPVWVTAQALRVHPFSRHPLHRDMLPFELDEGERTQTDVACNQSEFIDVVSIVFKSMEVKSKISSMVAKSNETKHLLNHLIPEESLSGDEAS